MSGSISEEAGKVAASAIDVFRSQPGLLFLTLVNIAFLGFVYLIAGVAIDAYNRQQEQMNDRYTRTIGLVDRCITAAFNSQPIPPTQPGNNGMATGPN